VSPAELRARLQCFAVRRGLAKKRADVNYHHLTEEVNRSLAHPRYDLAPVSSFEVMLQYGCSQRATEEPVGHPILRMSNLQADGWDLSDLKYVELTNKAFTRWLLKPGDIVFNRTNSKELVGKCEVFNEHGDWVFASYLMRLRVDRNRALPEFVSAFLNTRAGRLQIARESRQIIGMSNINAEEIRSLRVPLPSTSRQSELFAELNAARDARREKLAQADALLTGLDDAILDLCGLPTTGLEQRRVGAIRRVALEGPLNAERYLENSPAAKLKHDSSIPLDSAFDVVEEKITPTESAPSEQWACLRIDDFENEPLHPPHPRRLNGEDLIGAFFPVRDKDLLIARLGPPLLNGKIAVAHDCEARTVCSPEFLVLRPNRRYDPDVAMWILRSRPFRRVLYSKSRGSTPSRYRLMREELSNVRLPLLSDVQGKAIAAEVARRVSRVRQLRDEARTVWENAKDRFEEELLGPRINAGQGKIESAKEAAEL
jgi:type I restriction enzyme, S subunit